jgi:hypothetical protein
MTDRNTNATYESPYVADNTIPTYAILYDYAKALEKLTQK